MTETSKARKARLGSYSLAADSEAGSSGQSILSLHQDAASFFPQEQFDTSAFL